MMDKVIKMKKIFNTLKVLFCNHDWYTATVISKTCKEPLATGTEFVYTKKIIVEKCNKCNGLNKIILGEDSIYN